MSSNKLLFLKLNNYIYDDSVVNYLLDGTIPSHLTKKYQVDKFTKRWNDFKIEDDKLIYKNLNLEVVHNDDKDDKLKELYDDFKIGVGVGIKSFYDKVTQKYLNIKREDVRKFLVKQYPYQLTMTQKKSINKPISASFPNHRWACDLIDLTYYAGHNKKKKYILTVIDYFSKYTFAVGIINKEPKTIIKAFEHIYNNQSHIYPSILQSDNGTEFKNEELKEFCESEGIRQVFNQTHSPTGNSLVENFNKYLRKMINEGFVRLNNLNWVEHLDDYVYNRNHTKHKLIKFIPADVWKPTKERVRKVRMIKEILKSDEKLNNIEKQNKVLERTKTNVKNKLERYKDEKINVGDKVRILLSAIDTKLRKAIKQGNQKKIIVKFSPKVFTIKKIVYEDKELMKPKYFINSNEILQSFYYNQLLKVNDDAETVDITPSELNKV